MRKEKKRKNFLLMVLFTIIVFAGTLKPEPVKADAEWIWGPVQVGDDAYAVINSEDMLYVYGTGATYGAGETYGMGVHWMKDFYDTLPDGSFAITHIKHAWFEEGITDIGSSFLVHMPLYTVHLPDTLKIIGEHAFDLTELSSVQIPDGVEVIESEAFSSSKLSEVSIPASVRELGKNAFSRSISYGSNMEPADLEHLVLEVAEDNPYFQSLDNMILTKDGKAVVGFLGVNSDIVVPEGVEVIQSGAFQGIDPKSISLPESLKIIEDYAFYTGDGYKDGIDAVVLPDGLQKIGKSAFENCHIAEMNLPESLNYIGERGLAGNDFERIVLPENCEVGANVLSDCKKLRYMEVPDTVRGYSEELGNLKSLEFAVIKAPIQNITTRLFWGRDTSLKAIVLPDSVTSIEEQSLGYYWTRDYYSYRFKHRSKDLVIYGKPGSVVEEYAIENGFTFRDSASFQPPKKLAKSEGLTFSLSKTSYNYANKAWRPVVTIKDGDYTLVQGVDYKVSYENNKEVGTARVTVTGLNSYKGNNCYFGSKYFSYKILPRPTTISELAADKKGFTATIRKQATQTTGYQLRYSTSEDMSGAKTVTIADNTICRKQITKLKAKQKYYVQVRTYTLKDGKKYYSAWSNAKSIVTK